MADTDCLTLIKQRLSSMSATEQRIASYILAEPQKVVSLTMRVLASETGVSEGSVANFAGRLGFDGYTALKIAIARSLSDGGSPMFDNVNPSDSVKEVMRKMRDNTVDALRSTCETMSESDLAAAVELLWGAKRRIEVYGIGSSSMLAEDAAFRLIKLGLPAVVVKDSYISSVSALMLDSDCLALAISYTGRTHDIVKTMKIAKEKGAKTMCITCYADSPLARMCDCSLVAVSGEAVNSSSTLSGKLATVSRLAQLLIVDTLCAYIAAQRRDEALEKQTEIVDAWGEYWIE
ncbi:MAG: MurR/RpiR family transcriptional regulator [Clostridiales bacterium]|nr:MurR/RpiR family transcriptional regulator [Clostridiales bacterium]